MTQESYVEHAFGKMSNDCPKTQSRILFETLATGFRLDIRTGGYAPHVSPCDSPDRGLDVPCVSPCEHPDRGLECHVSNGGVPCEATTCTLRGGPYNSLSQ